LSCTARAELCDASKRFCGYFSGASSSSSPASPSRDNTVRINPSSVPVEKGFGLGVIAYDGFDFGLVKGLGRVGAAISPSNSEETFFGPPGIELPENYLQRKENGKKYPSQKLNLSTAVNLYSKKGSGLHRFEVNLGAMAKYNKLTKAWSPGGGISAVAGPFTFGYSLYKDQTQLDYSILSLSQTSVTKFTVETYSAGIFLNSVAVDYSILRMITNDVATTSVLTGSLFLKNSMITAAIRKEHSSRPAYDAGTKTLVQQADKTETFGGVQFHLFHNWMFGIFYNYYVLHELSIGATWFF
jgi:hypothetical protein